jgi:hypothetical protein
VEVGVRTVKPTLCLIVGEPIVLLVFFLVILVTPDNLGGGALSLALGFLILRFMSRTPRPDSPPLNLAILLYLVLDRLTYEAFVGDLEERYRLILRRHGKRQATVWYLSEVVRSSQPVILSAAKSTLRSALGWEILMEWLRRIIS